MLFDLLGISDARRLVVRVRRCALRCVVVASFASIGCTSVPAGRDGGLGLDDVSTPAEDSGHDTATVADVLAVDSPVADAADAVVDAGSQPVSWSRCGSVRAPARSFVVGESTLTQWFSERHPGSTPYVVQVDVPERASTLPDTQIAFAFGPYSGSGNRQLAISTTPCDFDNLFPLMGGTTVNISVDPAVMPSPRGVNLTPGRWFFSFRSAPRTGTNITCADGQTCAMNMQWQP